MERYIFQNRRVIITIMKENIFIIHISLHVIKQLCIRCIRNLRLCLDHVQKSPKSGQTFLHHLSQLHKNLNRTDKDSDIKRIHSKISYFHLPMGYEPASKYKRNQIHHALKEQISTHKASHTLIVRFLR